MRHFLLGLLLLLTTGCSSSSPPAARAVDHPNLVLVTLDGLSAERLALYGGKEAAPTLERLAREGVAYDKVFSQSNEPLFGQGALVSSRYATEISPLIPDLFVLRKDQLTLPKILGMYGYTCGGFHGDPALDDKHGFATGYAAYNGEEHCGSLTHLAGAAKQWISATKGPLFASIEATDCVTTPGARHDAAASHGASGLQVADTALGTLVDGLDPATTLVIVTAACGDPSATGPEAAFHVPLIVWGAGVDPKHKGSRVSSVVESVDLLPTLLAQGGVVIPAQIRGRDFGASFGPSKNVSEERHSAFAESTTGAGAIHEGRYALFASGAPAGSPALLARLSKPPGEGFDFYDLTQRPPKKMAPAQADAKLVDDLAHQLLAVEQNSIAVKSEYRKAIDPALADQLRKHGYWDAGK